MKYNDSLVIDGFTPLYLTRARFVLYQALANLTFGYLADIRTRDLALFKSGKAPQIIATRELLSAIEWETLRLTHLGGKVSGQAIYEWLREQGITVPGELPKWVVERAFPPKPRASAQQSTLDAAAEMLRCYGYTVIPPPV